MKKIALLGLLLAIVFSSVSYASTVLTDCGQTVTSDGILESDLNFSSGSYCFALGYDEHLDCQGHAINMMASPVVALYFPFGYTSPASIKNCILTNTALIDLIFAEQIAGITIENNTFVNSVNGIQVGIGGDGSGLIENNTFINMTGYGIGFGGYSYGNSANVTGNVFATSVVTAIEFNGYSTEDNIYNNKFLDGTSSIHFLTSFFSNWNTTLIAEKSITGGNNRGGNYWGVCNDANCTGICEEPIILDPNNIDYLPLSLCTPAPPPVNLPPITGMAVVNAWRQCNGSSLVTYSDYAYTNENGSFTHVISSAVPCQFGCSSMSFPNQCNTSPGQSNIFFFVILIMAIFVIIALISRYRR